VYDQLLELATCCLVRGWMILIALLCMLAIYPLRACSPPEKPSSALIVWRDRVVSCYPYIGRFC
jgi:hypothetical protein